MGKENQDGSLLPPLWRSWLRAVSSRRACLGQCFSYSVPNTFPQSTESLVHCDSCMPAQSMWEIVSRVLGPWPAAGRRSWVLPRASSLCERQGSCWEYTQGFVEDRRYS